MAAVEVAGSVPEESGFAYGLDPSWVFGVGSQGSVIMAESTVGSLGTGGGVPSACMIVVGLVSGGGGCELVLLLMLDQDLLSLRLRRRDWVDLGELMLPLLGVPSLSSPLKFSSSLNRLWLTFAPPFTKLAGEFFAVDGLLLSIIPLPIRERLELRLTFKRNRCG